MSRLAFSRDQLHRENIADLIEKQGNDARVYRIAVTLDEEDLPDIGFSTEMPDEAFLKAIRVFCEIEQVDDKEGLPGKKTEKALSVMTLDSLVVQPNDYVVIEGERYRVMSSAKIHSVRHLKLRKVK